MAVCIAFAVAVSVICVVMVVFIKNGFLVKFGNYGKDSKQPKRTLSPVKVLNLLKTNKLFPVGVSQGWLLSSLDQGCRAWSKVVPLGSSIQSITLYSAFTKVSASAQVIVQVLRDVTKTGEWCPRVVSSSQSSPTMEDTQNSYPSLPVQHDKVTEVIQSHDNLLDNKSEFTFQRIWHREDNGCCWMLKMSNNNAFWVFFLAQPAEDAEHSLLTVISPDNKTGEFSMGVSNLLGCLDDHLSYRKTPFTPLMSITLPQAHLLENMKSKSVHILETTSNNNNSSEEENFLEKEKMKQKLKQEKLKELDTREADNQDSLSGSSSGGKDPDDNQESLSGSNSGGKYPDIIKSRLSVLKEDGQAVISGCSTSNYVMKFEKSFLQKGDKSSKEEFSCSLSHADLSILATERPADRTSPIRRVESDPSLFIKREAENSPKDVKSVETSPKTDEERRRTRLLISANQAAAEVLIQSFKASSVDVSKTSREPVTVETCPGGWMFSGLDKDVVVLRRLFKNGMSTQSYLSKGVIHASPKTVWNALRNPRLKFTYDETLKKVDILESVSESIKIVYFYHEVVQLFRKDSCDFCVLQSERIDGEKHILSLQSMESEWAPKLPGTLRGKLLPSGWIVEPVKTNKKVVSMVTFLMQMDLGPGRNGNSLPFEDFTSRQPLAIAQLREYFLPLTSLFDKHHQ